MQLNARYSAATNGLGFALGQHLLENFKVYQMAKQFYWSCKELKFPQHLEGQLLSASSSIALNLSEATGRRTRKDQRRHYAIAFGSLQECRTILELERVDDAALLNMADQLAAMLYTLSRKKVENDPDL